ncbi:helix-turn-helix transcriptional regulator [Acidaminobacter sp. JC074]|uniref:ArsR/SmtB family transcription factor n=1 Tax=Acidaminobacter sp. JC074 TaxID=2530199 RepID=UPI001F0E2546|nr:winged helix-turn-helix domain-containing protein [Acidaminobacter sp. JC074]
MAIKFEASRWLLRDVIHSVYIMCVEDYEALMYKHQGFYPNKQVIKLVDKLKKKFPFDEMNIAYMIDEDFGTVIVNAISIETIRAKSFDEITDIISNMVDDTVMDAIVRRLGKSATEDFDTDYALDRSNYDQVMDFVNKLSINKNIKWDVYKFLLDPSILFSKLVDGLKRIYPTYQKEIKKYEKDMTSINTYLQTELDVKGEAIFSDVLEGVIDVSSFDNILIRSSFINSKALVCEDVDGVLYLEVGFEFREAIALIRGKNDEENMLNTIGMIADPMKFKLITLMKEEAMYGKELCEATGLSKAALSYHIHQLRNIGIINDVKEGNKTYYSLKREKLTNMVESFLENIR